MTLPLALFLSVGAIALFSFISVATWSDNRRREREAFYKNEALKKFSDMPAADALSVLREEDRLATVRRREGIILGGLVTAAVGVGVMAFFRAIAPDRPVYVLGLIPLLVGAALLTYSYVLAPKQ